ncbi:hypothetical protein [Streptomyces virginiae]|uniref:hypothetical protein n=1 Tax=Streptomyces virginiae TaxID=1961 RepID=UPI002DBF7DDF|nr:hypothetical protein [Streptomyces sp. CMAA1738]MEC4574949.1 hypothetical protein [Streptomyces sp. CMAA1738]
MDGYQALTALLESAWKELDGCAAGRRDLCLDAIGDVLETGRLTPDDAVRAVERLVTIALSDEGYPVRESALHATCTAATHYELPYGVVEPLAVAADDFEPLLLDYVLGILGATHDLAALPVVERFLLRPHPEVRRVAAEEVKELRRSRQSARANAGGSPDVRRICSA